MRSQPLLSAVQGDRRHVARHHVERLGDRAEWRPPGSRRPTPLPRNNGHHQRCDTTPIRSGSTPIDSHHRPGPPRARGRGRLRRNSRTTLHRPAAHAHPHQEPRIEYRLLTPGAPCAVHVSSVADPSDQTRTGDMSRIIQSKGFRSVAVDGANDRADVVQDPHRATSRAAPMILLIGATGRTGSEVVSQLAAADERTADLGTRLRRCAPAVRRACPSDRRRPGSARNN